jgi:hypothetical protein
MQKEAKKEKAAKQKPYLNVNKTVGKRANNPLKRF